MGWIVSIEETLAEMARAWNAGDGVAWAASFAPDADLVDVVGRVHHGRDVIAAEHQKIFDTIYRGSLLEYWLTDSRPIGDGLVLAHTASTLRVLDGPRAGEWHAVQTKVFRDGQIVAFHNGMRMDPADFAHEDDSAR
ncbi:uncharacterized protein (TIGR02246 family) [Actinocrispum wychmicini]|uniref:Uncharacterized protein (TIGR02246 family) n=1 Tax=Actinocrispum wychmicini TaxID=1213861 RepID=A0A4R2J5C9_9PSEU|nr:uncharacterized protein (TIGR02246 family) [Actinocrispum wychmicini]